MKKALVILLAIALFAPGAFADEVDDKLAAMATERVRNSARQMINAGINTDDAVTMTRQMIRNQYTERHMLRAHEIVRQARQEELPAEPVMNKAYEGMAKRVGEEKVVRAMETVRSRYAYSYQKAGEVTEDKARKSRIGNAIAESLTAGVSKGDVEAIMDRVRERTRDMTRDQSCELAQQTFTAARDMARLGVSSGAATDVVGQALQKRYSAMEMEQFRNAFMNQSRYSNAEALATSFSAQIGSGVSAGNLGSSGAHGGSGAGGTGAGSGSGSGGPGAGGGSDSGGSGGSDTGGGSGSGGSGGGHGK